MHNNLKEITFREIKNRYKTERKFYEDILKVKKSQWKYWKNNDYTLIEFEEKIISKLFTKYEWQLAQEVAQKYADGIGINDFYETYIELKVKKMLEFLSTNSRIAVKDIDPNQKHAEEKYRVPKIRLYVERITMDKVYVTKIDGVPTGEIVSLIIHNKRISDLPGNQTFLKKWVESLAEDNIPKGV